MSKGIIYVMTTVVSGLVKIGKTGVSNFEGRMYELESNGYKNVAGLKRHFAIEVEDYDDKERLLQDIFSKSRIEGKELFALDIDLVVQLLSSFEGKQIYPVDKTKDELFDEASNKRDTSKLPEGTYSINKKIKRWDNNSVKGTMEYKNGKFIVKAGSICCPVCQNEKDPALAGVIKAREKADIIDNILQKDEVFKSPSTAAQFLTFSTENGWHVWKNSQNKSIDVYRKDK